jgi:hypothetical protein
LSEAFFSVVLSVDMLLFWKKGDEKGKRREEKQDQQKPGFGQAGMVNRITERIVASQDTQPSWN